MENIKNIEYLKYYIRELESRNGDIDQINKLKKELETLSKNNSQKTFKERIKYDVTVKEKRKLKNKVALGIIIGGTVISGYCLHKAAYNYVMNMPSAHNHRTVKEAREGKEHDPSRYIEYLRIKGYSEKEIQEKLNEFEIKNNINIDIDRE